MKKCLTGMLSLALLAAMALPALAANSNLLIAPAPDAAPAAAEETAATGYAVEIDGEDSGVRAQVMVPLRAVAEKLGFTVTWDNGTVTVTGPERYAQLTVGVDQYFAAPTQEGMMGASLFSLGCAPYVFNDATYVPVELFDALLGCKEETVVLDGNTVKISADAASMNTAQLPSPFTGHTTLAEAAKAVGFELTVPEKVGSSPRRNIETMSGEMIQVFYGNDENEICVRKEAGSGDISGDYNQYAQSKTAAVNGSTVTMRGENGLIMVAIWESGGYTYAVTSRAGMSAAAMTALVQSVN